MPPEAGHHEHVDECAELYAAWRRYHGVAEDASGAFTKDDRLNAARERAMLARLLAGAGCDPYALLTMEQSEDAAGEDAAGEDVEP